MRIAAITAILASAGFSGVLANNFTSLEERGWTVAFFNSVDCSGDPFLRDAGEDSKSCVDLPQVAFSVFFIGPEFVGTGYQQQECNQDGLTVGFNDDSCTTIANEGIRSYQVDKGTG